MNRKEKEDIIGRHMVIGDAQLTDAEVNLLYDIVSRPEKYDGLTRSVSDYYVLPEGTARYIEGRCTLHVDSDGIRIEDICTETGEDGYEDHTEKVFSDAGTILRFADVSFGLRPMP